jgi:hypothetical protein
VHKTRPTSSPLLSGGSCKLSTQTLPLPLDSNSKTPITIIQQTPFLSGLHLLLRLVTKLGPTTYQQATWPDNGHTTLYTYLCSYFTTSHYILPPMDPHCLGAPLAAGAAAAIGGPVPVPMATLNNLHCFHDAELMAQAFTAGFKMVPLQHCCSDAYLVLLRTRLSVDYC